MFFSFKMYPAVKAVDNKDGSKEAIMFTKY